MSFFFIKIFHSHRRTLYKIWERTFGCSVWTVLNIAGRSVDVYYYFSISVYLFRIPQRWWMETSFLHEIKLHFKVESLTHSSVCCVFCDVHISCSFVNQLNSLSATSWCKNAVNTSDVMDDSELTNVVTDMFWVFLYYFLNKCVVTSLSASYSCVG